MQRGGLLQRSSMALNIEKIGHLVRELLIEIGEDPAREGLLDTPKRVAKAFEFPRRAIAPIPRN